MREEHNSMLIIDPEGVAWLDCDACGEHINITQACNACAGLKDAGREVPKVEEVGGFLNWLILSLICDFWRQAVSPDQCGITKALIRDALPGLRGDMLTQTLLSLLKLNLVVQGDCGNCYVPVEAAKKRPSRGARWLDV